MSIAVLTIGLILGLIWLLILSFFYYRLDKHYNTLLSGSDNGNLQTLLDTVMKEQKQNRESIGQLLTRCDTLELNNTYHIQKIGLLRFNPFNDTGGDQSFILALLDANDTGVVISGLYSRSGTRWYAKRIVQGKGKEHELSQEEKKAIAQAASTK